MERGNKTHRIASDRLELARSRSLAGHGLNLLFLLTKSRVAMRVHLLLPRKRDLLSLDLLVLLLLLFFLVLVALVLLLLLLRLLHLGLIDIHDIGFPLLILLAALLVLLGLLRRWLVRVNHLCVNSEIITTVAQNSLHGAGHGLLVLDGLLARGVELETVLELLAQDLTEARRWVLREVVNTRRHTALVGEVTRDAALDLGSSAADKGRLVNQTVLGRGALGLEGAEEGLFGTEDLQRRGGVLGQVGEGAGVGDEAGGDGGAENDLQVGRDDAHLLIEGLGERLAVVGHLAHGLGELLDHDEIGLGDVQTHGHLGRIDNVLGLVAIVVGHSGNLVQAVVSQRLLVTNDKHQLGVGSVVANNAHQLGKVPAVPLAHAHAALVNTLVKSVEGSNGLDNVVVVLVDAELDLGARVGVAHTQLCAAQVAFLQALEKLLGVNADAAQKIGNNFGGVAGFALHTGEGGADFSSELLILHTENDLGLLAGGLGKVQLEGGFQVVGHDAFGEEIDVLEGLGGISEN